MTGKKKEKIGLVGRAKKKRIGIYEMARFLGATPRYRNELRLKIHLLSSLAPSTPSSVFHIKTCWFALRLLIRSSLTISFSFFLFPSYLFFSLCERTHSLVITFFEKNVKRVHSRGENAIR